MFPIVSRFLDWTFLCGSRPEAWSLSYYQRTWMSDYPWLSHLTLMTCTVFYYRIWKEPLPYYLFWKMCYLVLNQQIWPCLWTQIRISKKLKAIFTSSIQSVSKANHDGYCAFSTIQNQQLPFQITTSSAISRSLTALFNSVSFWCQQSDYQPDDWRWLWEYHF